jgi:undecaprenyl-diphosphatase
MSILLDSLFTVLAEQLLRLDAALLFWVNRYFIHPSLDSLFLFIREPMLHIPLYVFLLLFSFQLFGRKAVWWILVGIALIGLADLISSHLIKDYFNRPRPCRDPFFAYHIRFLARYCGANGSFTSSHAVNHFAFATYVFMTLRSHSRWFGLFFFWAGLIAYAQVYVGVHFPSDVLAGGVLGSLFGWIGARIARQTLSLHILP